MAHSSACLVNVLFFVIFYKSQQSYSIGIFRFTWILFFCMRKKKASIMGGRFFKTFFRSVVTRIWGLRKNVFQKNYQSVFALNDFCKNQRKMIKKSCNEPKSSKSKKLQGVGFIFPYGEPRLSIWRRLLRANHEGYNPNCSMHPKKLHDPNRSGLFYYYRAARRRYFKNKKVNKKSIGAPR